MIETTDYQIVRLFFTSPLHLSRGQTEEYDRAANMLHSDTIAGAIAAAYAQLYPNSDIWSFMDSFAVSSAFPFHNETLFFPKPMTKLPIKEDSTDLGMAKKIKKAAFLDQKLFEKVLNKLEIDLNTVEVSNGMMSSLPGASHSFFKKDVQQRVMVPRGGDGDSVTYYIERTWFAENSGLYFFIKSEGDLATIETCLRYLADTGVGTDKSVGNGQFKLSEPIIETIHLEVSGLANAQLAMSLYCPEKEELSQDFLNNSAYNLELRGGYMAGSSNEKLRHLRKKKVYMFSCGSVFPMKILSGKILDLSPEWNEEGMHPVYRSGKGFFIPIDVTH